ncbi:MAG: glycine zipper domain-containing protein [Methylobacter sp.]
MGTLDRTSEYVHDVAEYAHEATDKIAGATIQAADVLSEQGERLLNAEQKLMKSCGKYVRANPVTSVGIMIAVGFALAGLLSKRD